MNPKIQAVKHEVPLADDKKATTKNDTPQKRGKKPKETNLNKVDQTTDSNDNEGTDESAQE